MKDIHTYGTRSSASDNFYTNYSRLNTQKDSFSRVGVRLWNQMPIFTRNLSKKNYRKEIKTVLLNDLNTNGYDTEISKLLK